MDGLLGKGYFGDVYEASIDDKIKLAIKILHDDSARDPRKLDRFRRESSRIAELKDCEQIVKVFNEGVAEQDGSDLHYYVMERWGWSLDALFDAGWKFTPEDIVKIIGTCCDGLEYASGKGILHTDLHLGNILVNDNLEAKLSDFGMMLDDPQEILRKNSRITLDPLLEKQSTFMNRYAAPEILNSGRKAATKLSDLYSLGRIGLDLLEKIDPKGDYGRFAHLRSVFNKAASYSPEERFKSFGAFKKALEGRKTNWLAIGAITAGLGLLVGTGYLLTRRHSTDYSQYAPSPTYSELADAADAEACGGSPEPTPDAGPDIESADTPLPDSPIVTDASAPKLVTRIFCSDGKIKMGRTRLTADDLASPYLHSIPRFPTSEDNEIRDYLWIKTDVCMDNNHNVATAANLTEVRRFLEARGPIPEENTTYWGYPREEDKDLIPFVRCEQGPGGILRAYLDLDKINLDHLDYIIHRTEPLYPGGEGGGLLFINLGECLEPHQGIVRNSNYNPSGDAGAVGAVIVYPEGRQQEVRFDAGTDDRRVDARRSDANGSTRPDREDAESNARREIVVRDRDNHPPYSLLGAHYVYSCEASGIVHLTTSAEKEYADEESTRLNESIIPETPEGGQFIIIEHPENCPNLAERHENGIRMLPIDAGTDASARDARQSDAGTGYHPLAIMQDNPLIIPASQRDRIDGGYGFRDLGDVDAILTCNSDGTRFLKLDDQFWNRTHPNLRTESDFRTAIEAGWNIRVENPENCPDFAEVIHNTPRGNGAL